MVKIYPHVAGNTFDSHKEFLKSLTAKGAKKVKSPEESEVIIVFCPIVTRFETDIDSALSSTPGSERQEVILVAMHHTFDTDYTVGRGREQNKPRVTLLVDCLFYENKGLLKCSRNKKAVEMVCKELNLPATCCFSW